MTTNKFFQEAKKQNVSPLEVVYSKSTALSVGVFNDNVEEYVEENSSSITLRGIYNGNLGIVSSDNTSPKMAETYINSLKTSAKYGLKGDPDLFITKGQKYKKSNKFNQKAFDMLGKQMIDDSLYISKKVREADSRIELCMVDYSKSSFESQFSNSNGLSLKDKGAHLVLYAQTKIVSGNDVETDYDFTIVEDPDTFDKDAFIEKLVKSSISRLGSESVKSKKYNVVFSQRSVAQLIRPLISQLSVFSVKQHLSLFDGKLNTQVLSPKLTIIENPYTKTPFASTYDREGMPRKKKVLINKGVVQTYLYDLENAKKDGVETTGNASMSGGNIRPGLGFIEIKEGKLDFDSLLAKIKTGIYIDSLDGIGTGYNTQSGDYSLQASGFEIVDGKLGKPVSLITVAGNVLKDFNNILCVGKDTKLSFNQVSCPSIAIKKLAISGK